MMKKMVLALGIGFAAGAYVLTGDGGPTAERVGYFKSERRDRVVAYQLDAPVSEDKAREILGKAMNTPGTVTMAVLYEPGALAPGHDLTLAPDLISAMRLVGENYPGWSHRLRINPGGRYTFD